MANPLASMMSKNQSILTPEIKQQIKSMYKAYKDNPNAFINQVMQNNPQLRDNKLLSLAMSGGNPQKLLRQMLAQTGITESEFIDLLS